MPVSPNTFSKEPFSEGTNTFSKTITGVDGTMQRIEFPQYQGASGWDGDNVGGGGYGMDSIYGGDPYGMLGYEGISHFLDRTTNPDIDHNP